MDRLTPDPVILVGHSMGGRIGIRLLADLIASGRARSRLSALVIEDMDARIREYPSVGAPDRRWYLEDGRLFDTWREARSELLKWYDDPPRVDSWKGKRVRQRSDGKWWSDINPAAQLLAKERTLMTADAQEGWLAIARAAQRGVELPLVQLWVAGSDGTVCAWDGEGGLDSMEEQYPGVGTVVFHGAAHSVHNSKEAEFLEALRRLVRMVDG